MAITSYANYAAALGGRQRQRCMVTKTVPNSSITTTGFNQQMYSGWTWPNKAGAQPTTAAVPTNLTAGSFGQQNSSGTQRILAASVQTSFVPANLDHFGDESSPPPPGTYAQGLPTDNTQTFFSQTFGAPQGLIVIADRLSHQGGIGTIQGTVTTNLPTAALTRYTTGVGVEAAFECYGAYTPFNRDFTNDYLYCNYTNQSGTTGVASQKLFISTSVNGSVYANDSWLNDRLLTLPLAGSDTGVRAVASLSASFLNASSNSGGVTLFYPLLVIPIVSSTWSGANGGLGEALFAGGCWFPQVQNGAALFPIVSLNSLGPSRATAPMSGTSASTGIWDYPQQYMIDLLLAED